MDQRGQALQPVATSAQTRSPRRPGAPWARHGRWPIVLPNQEALWFTTRDIDVDTPRLVIPWSLFQYLAMSRRSLSGFQSWGKVGVVYIRPCGAGHHTWGTATWVHYGSHPGGEPHQLVAHGPSVCVPRAPRRGSAHKCQHGGVPPKFQLPGLPPEAKVSESIFIQAKDRPVVAGAHYPASTTSLRTRCHWRRRLGKQTMPPIAWVCGRESFWARRTRVLLQRVYHPRLLPGRPLQLPLRNPRLQQLNQLLKRSRKMRIQTWSLQLRRERRWPELRRSVPNWNDG